ncbi:ABC-2 type transport system permease protein [Micromonospora rhizosphaerae]|uniref:ABC-2 type transport system permease protein n=1 Tax=Micromonospora rhizosphaerae TaxID=568872 RepID=A0A1C6RID7_9ACTN|nr:ABC transporter permease [Micromonospora rhizosphaerae]SCL16941.1 ABC-2 type transport system permease protein [Micromonospora rhizosphaerae]
MSTLTGTRHLVRLILRRDRVLLPLWVLVLSLLPMTYATSFFELFPTAAERAAYAAGTARNPSIIALLGPVYGDSVGALTAQRGGFLTVIIGLFSLLTVIRHTRTEEEAGRRELLGGSVLGRYAGLTAALLVTYAADLLLGLLTAAGLASTGLPAGGSLAYGLAAALAGVAFATVGGLAAQLTESAGGARGIAIGVLGLAFALRLAGDAAERDWLSWLSPLGWAPRIRAYEGEHWWVLLLPVALSVLLAAVAYPLSVRRDLGAGLLPARLGPATARRALSGSFGLAWRLHRGQLLGWSVGFGLLGLILGGAAEAAGKSVEGNPQLEEIMSRIGGASGLAEAYLGATLSLAGLAAAGYGIQAALRMRAEETAGRAEPLLATGVHRSGWLLSHLVFALLGPVVVLAVTGSATGLTYGISVHDVPGELTRMIGAGLAQVPAAWVLAGLAVLLYGLLPRLAPVAWAVLAVCVLLGQLGAVLELSQWLLDVSPFTHTPQVLSDHWSATPLLVLAALALLMALAGLTAFRRRDVPVT